MPRSLNLNLCQRLGSLLLLLLLVCARDATCQSSVSERNITVPSTVVVSDDINYLNFDLAAPGGTVFVVARPATGRAGVMFVLLHSPELGCLGSYEVDATPPGYCGALTPIEDFPATVSLGFMTPQHRWSLVARLQDKDTVNASLALEFAYFPAQDFVYLPNAAGNLAFARGGVGPQQLVPDPHLPQQPWLYYAKTMALKKDGYLNVLAKNNTLMEDVVIYLREGNWPNHEVHDAVCFGIGACPFQMFANHTYYAEVVGGPSTSGNATFLLEVRAGVAPSPSASPSPRPTPSVSQYPQNLDDGEGLLIGLGVGGGVLVIGIIGVAFVIIRRRRRLFGQTEFTPLVVSASNSATFQ